MRLASTLLLLAVVLPASPLTAADGIDAGTTWEELQAKGHSLVFGRLRGRFDGTEYRGRKIRVRNQETGDDYLIAVEKGLDFFEAALPSGTYSVVAVEAIYFPRIKPMKLDKFPPVRQRYALRPISGAGLPTFPVVVEKPVYLGTIRSGIAREGLVYEGHAIEILDEYSEALAHLGSRHAPLAASFTRGQIEPARYFFVKPVPQESLLEIAAETDPLGQARDYIADGKFERICLPLTLG